MLENLGLNTRQSLAVLIMIALVLMAIGALVQLFWPQVSAGLFVLVTAAYMYWSKQRDWSAVGEVAHEHT
jgi:predicted tellurium resistance membrane protein TerC